MDGNLLTGDMRVERFLINQLNRIPVEGKPV